MRHHHIFPVLLLILALLGSIAPLTAAAPQAVPLTTIVIDGVKEAEWGDALAMDPQGDISEPNLDLVDLYAVEDADNVYVGLDALASTWGMTYGIYIDVDNVAGSGGNSDPWGRGVTAVDQHRPEFALYVWHRDDDTLEDVQLVTWNGAGWDYPTLVGLGGEQGYGPANDWLEVKIPKAALGITGDAAFYLEAFTTGGGGHAQDSVPSDPNVNYPDPDWGGDVTQLSAFAEFPPPAGGLLVTFPGNYPSAAGLGNDWAPDNLNTQASEDNGDGVWKFVTDQILAGSYEFKATVGGTWDENYGLNGVPGGPNVPFTVAEGDAVHFYYDRGDNYVASRPGFRIPVLVGNLMGAVGGADWSPDNLVGWMKDRDFDGWYEIALFMPEGNYEYKVALNESWAENYGAEGVPGGANITLAVPAGGQRVTFRYNDTTHQIQDSINNPAFPEVGDGDIWWDGLGHSSRSDLYRQPFGAVVFDTDVTLRFRTYMNDVQSVKVRVQNLAAGGQRTLNMVKAATDPLAGPFGYDWWEATFNVGNAVTLHNYTFALQDGNRIVYYADDAAEDGGWGEPSSDPPPANRAWNVYTYQPDFATPDWAQNGIIYQIFPDRFRNGDPSNDSTDAEWFYPAERGHRFPITPWNTIVPDPEPNNPTDNPEWWSTFSSTSYGGDLQGVMDKLDYLQELGVTVIYFNPLFESPSNHRYDGRSYRQIDDNLGVVGDYAASLALFEALADEMANRGMSIILDAVPNHLSSDSPFFDRFGRHPEVGACEAVDSPCRNWFFFEPAIPAGTGVCAGDTNYRAWFGVETLPQVNTAHPDILDFWFGADSTATYWLEKGADGWRVDVVPDVVGVNPTFFEQWRDVTKAAYPDSIMYSETWGEQDARERLLGDEFDSTMNYRFRNALLGFLRDDNFNDNDGGVQALTATQFENRLRAIQEDLPKPAFDVAMNLLGSHDTNRPVRVLDHDGIDYGTLTPIGGFADGRQRLKLVAAMQLTLPGAPTIYYGDEVGLVGFGSDVGRDDPYNRQPYPWPDEPDYDTLPDWRRQQADLLAHYQALGQLRNSKSYLRTGSWDTFVVDDAGLYVYGRKDATGAAIVAVNRDDAAHTVVLDLTGYVPLGAHLVDPLDGGAPLVAAADTTFDVAAMDFQIWVTEEGVDMTVPYSPLVMASSEGDGLVTLTLWNDHPDQAQHVIYRSIVNGGYARVGTVDSGTPGSTVVFTDDTVTNGQAYYYQVTTVASKGMESAPSGPVVLTPHHTIGWANLQWPPEVNHVISAINSTDNIYGQVWIDGVTSQPGATPSLMAQAGYGPAGSVPADGGWVWVDGEFNVDAGNNDEFKASFLPEMVGEYVYVYRYSTTGGREWLYADQSGPLPDASTLNQPGLLHVLPSDDTSAPDAPSNLREVSRSANQITIAWDASPSEDVHHYLICRNEVTWLFVACDHAVRVPADQTTYTDTDVVTGQTYEYTVYAVDGSFNVSAPSNAVPITSEVRDVQVTFRAHVPPYTPEGSTVYIAGDNAAVFGASWNPGHQALTQVDDLLWEWTTMILEGTALQYKYARGRWEINEWWGDLVGVANRQVTIEFGADGTQLVDDIVHNWRDLLAVEVSPAPGETEPDLSQITVLVNRPINPASAWQAGLTVADQAGNPVPGTVQLADGGEPAFLVFTPDPPLVNDQIYTALFGPGPVGADNDGVGVQVPFSWTFGRELGDFELDTSGFTASPTEVMPYEDVRFVLTPNNLGKAADVFVFVPVLNVPVTVRLDSLTNGAFPIYGDFAAARVAAMYAEQGSEAVQALSVEGGGMPLSGIGWLGTVPHGQSELFRFLAAPWLPGHSFSLRADVYLRSGEHAASLQSDEVTVSFPEPMTETFAPHRDTYISKLAPEASYSQNRYLRLRQPDVMEGLLYFNLSPIPPAATVTEAKLKLYPILRSGNQALNLSVYPLGERWASDVTWNTAPAWVEPAVATMVVDVVGQEIELDVTGLVQQWVNDPSTNFGLALVAPAGEKVMYAFMASEAGPWPMLEVSYQ
ncbi:MAG: DNRLRE domain-containing protein [Chloroflexi bacterium]|nr:DNRLRE domain-containing protein [Chloroflexota bacterium]